jgi:type IV pilus assembly protein PilV
MKPHRSCSRGFTLIEIMVALVVISAGMLAISRLLVEGLKIHRIAIHRAAAVGLAADMAERLRAAGSGPLVEREKAEWRKSIGDRLPSGATGEVEMKPGRYDIRLQWPETGQQAFAAFELSVHRSKKMSDPG